MNQSDAVLLAKPPQHISFICSSIDTLERLQGKADSIPKLLYPKKKIPQTRMMRKELHLARTIKQHIILPKAPQALVQPISVMLELLKRIKHSPVRPQLFLRHDLFKRDQVPHVERAGVGRAIVGRVEVHDGAFAADGGEELLHAVAVGGLAGAGGADDQLGEGHGGCSVPLQTRWPPEFVAVVCGGELWLAQRLPLY